MSGRSWLARRLMGREIDRLDDSMSDLRTALAERDVTIETMRLATVALERRLASRVEETERAVRALTERMVAGRTTGPRRID